MKKTIIATSLMTLMGAWAYADDASVSLQPSPPLATSSVDHRFGLGAVFGEPTGLSAKYFFDDVIAIDAVVGWGFHEETHFYTHADVLWHLNDLFHVSRGRLPLYFGVGPRLKLRDAGEERFGVRFPIGISYMFDRAPVDIFVEVAPILDFTPDTHGEFTAGVGVRYWF